MGIKGLSSFLKRKFPSAFDVVPVSMFKNKIVAVDATLVICCNKAKENFIESLKSFLKLFTKNQINIVLVFDGKSPVEKTREKNERKCKRRAAKDLARALNDDVEEYRTRGNMTDLLCKTADRLKKRKNLATISVDDLTTYVKSLQKRSENVTREDIQAFKAMAESMDIPIVEATGEAEIKCSSLAKRGLVDAVYTCDTDALACLTPLTILGITSANYFRCISMVKLLKCLKLERDSFVDFCISCGTDFNKNVAGYGPNKMYNLIKMYGSLEALEKVMPEIKTFNYDRIRGIFSSSNGDSDDERRDDERRDDEEEKMAKDDIAVREN